MAQLQMKKTVRRSIARRGEYGSDQPPTTQPQRSAALSRQAANFVRDLDLLLKG